MPQGRTELHFHLLPDVDDGPVDDAEAIALARLALADGTREVTCTPHVQCVGDGSEVAERVAALRGVLAAAGVDLAIRTGGELMAPDVLGAAGAFVERFAQGPPHARWLLIEAPLDPGSGGVDDLCVAIDEVADRGYGVLLGHPERSAALRADPGVLDALLSAGVALQVNATSLTGRHGAEARDAGFALVHRGLVRVLASDAHGVNRPPSLSAALAELEEAGVRGATRLAAAAPAALLEHGLAAPRALRDSA